MEDGRRDYALKSARALHRLVVTFSRVFPDNAHVAGYRKILDGVMLTSPMAVYENFRDKVYTQFKDDIQARDSDHLISDESIAEVRAVSGGSPEIIDMFVEMWGTLDARMKTYVFDVLGSVCTVIERYW